MEFFLSQIYKYKLYIKYVISGGTAASVDLILLYILTDIFGIWYLLSACLAFVVAFFVSFYMQKFWTFRDNNRERIYQQMSLYLMVGVFNLGINAGGMYILVDKFHIMYILAQIIMGGIIAISSFLIYKFIIFSARGGYDFGGKKQKEIKHEPR
jgi:putative flippase GtrA